MAGDWIKMKRGLRHDPKVIAMARHMGGQRAFMDWWTDPQQQTASRHVTEYVTFANVTRVTVCALLDVWASLNNTIKADGKAPFMDLQDLDDIAEIPSFGEAMKAVGWVIEEGDGGLVFPNFEENNTPAKSREGTAKTDAERAKEYRARKKAEKEQSESVTASRHVTTEKRREEKSTKNPLPPKGGKGSDDRILPKNWRKLNRQERKNRKVSRNSPAMQKLGAWFGRRASTLWTIAEAGALLELKPSSEEIDLLEDYYLAEIDEDFRRRDLLTLLNNWQGELDRARVWQADSK